MEKQLPQQFRCAAPPPIHGHHDARDDRSDASSKHSGVEIDLANGEAHEGDVEYEVREEMTFGVQHELEKAHEDTFRMFLHSQLEDERPEIVAAAKTLLKAPS